MFPTRRKRRKNSRLLFLTVLILVALWVWSCYRHIRTSHFQNDLSNRLIGTQKTQVASPTIALAPASYYQQEHTATFNGFPLKLQTGPIPQSSVECHTPPVEVLGDEMWKFRSCVYRNICFDTETMEFVLSSHQKSLLHNPSVAIGGINPRWEVEPQKPDRNGTKVKWKPSVQASTISSNYFQLDDSVLLVPFHSMAAHNVGHLLWDDLLAIYSLIRSWYGTPPSNNDLLLLRYVLPTKLYANCDIRRNKRIQCTDNLRRFGPLLLSSHNITSTRRTQLTQADPTTTIVCARHGLAGLGMWTDHGRADHGWEAGPVVGAPHNLGRGPLLYDWSRHHNIAKVAADESIFRITLSIQSSRDSSRNWSDWKQYLQVVQRLPRNDIVSRALEMKTLALDEQIALAQSTSLWVTVCGGGAVTATWLPRNAVLVVLYSPTAGLDFASMTGVSRPTRLDGDLWNHASYLRVHWLPLVEGGESVFEALVEHEYAAWRRHHP